MTLLNIDQDTCTQDGLCIKACPAGLIEFGTNGYPRPIAEADELCIRCGHCVAVCPTASLVHQDIHPEHGPPIRKDLALSLEQCEQFVRSRRSIRNYKDTPVEQNTLARLIDIARYAPSGHNTQGAQWLVLGNREELNRLSALVADWMGWMIENKPDIAAMMHMERTLAFWKTGYDVFLRGAPDLIVAHAHKDDPVAPTTCTIALTTLELAAPSLGLGCCWAGYFNTAATYYPPLQEALPLPEGHKSLGAMMVGYPKFRYQRMPPRKEPPIIWRMGDD